MSKNYKPMSEKAIEETVQDILSKMSVKEKASMLAGKDNWATMNVDRLGIKTAIVTDGPHGVRHPQESDRIGTTSTFFPTGVSFASSWNPELVEEVGEALGEETRGTGCDVLLGPCINIIRHPLAGRNFESYSEDPFLAGEIGAAYVNGVQRVGAGTSLKHFALNNQEFERGRGNSVCDERTMREIYLAAFEKVVKKSQPWTVMCSYNRINGAYASQNHYLLTEILRDEWGFKGLVMSDWGATHAIDEALSAGLDLEMGGPAKYFRTITESVNNWQIHEKILDLAVSRILRMLCQVGKIGDTQMPEGCNNTPGHAATAKKLADESITLLKNDGILPLNKKIKKVAVIGKNAMSEVSGGGSARVTPPYYITPLDALKEKFGGQIEFIYEEGAYIYNGHKKLNQEICTTDNGESGVKGEYFDNMTFSGTPITTRREEGIDKYWWDGANDAGISENRFSIRWTAKLNVTKAQEYGFIANHSNSMKILVDGKTVIDNNRTDFSKYDQETVENSIFMEEGSHDIEVLYVNTGRDHATIAFVNIKAINDDFNEVHIAKASRLAAECDAAIIFTGMPSDYESEGRDRTSMRLLSAQDELVASVAGANKNTVVVLQTGVAIEMPWIDEVPAIVEGYYFGQEGGRSVADILFGDINPSGKLSQTFPVKLQDTPAYLDYPGSKEVFYGEGIFVGYRYYDKRGVDTLFPFGHGLSYTTYEYGNIECRDTISENGDLEVSIKIKNTGNMDGMEVVQLYVRDVESSVLRPVKELKGFKKVKVAAGGEESVQFSLDARAFSFYCPYEKKWTMEKGEFEILAGASSKDIRTAKLVKY